MTITSVWVGAVTESSAWVRAKVAASSARLAVDLEPGLANPAYFDAEGITAQGMTSIRARDLDANTTYFYAVETDGVLDTAQAGQFSTHPPIGSPTSFRFGVSSCAGLEPLTPGVSGSLTPDRISNHTGFDVLRKTALSDQWLFFAHVGDMHYYNPGSGQFVTGDDADLYRRCWDDVLLQPRQHELYRNVPLVYAWDDHDFGPNDSDRTDPGRFAAQQVFREKVPSYPLPAEADQVTGSRPIYHSFQVGRVLFIVSDTRSERSPDSAPETSSKTFLGYRQKQWMRDVLSTSPAEFFVWLVPTPPFIYGTYVAENVEMADMFAELGWSDRMVAATGDSHHLGIDSGQGVSRYPLFACGPIDSRSNAGASVNYDIGSTDDQHADTVRSMYGAFEVEDTGTQITVTGAGIIAGTKWQSYSVSVTTDNGGDDGDGDQPRPDVSTAEPRTHVTWYGCDLISGRIIAELPDITGSVKRVLTSSTSTGLSLPIPLGGPGALGDVAWQATAPGRTMIVPVVNAKPSAGFIVLTRKGGTVATLDLGVISLEGYLDRRYVGDHVWTDTDEADIAAALAADANVDGIELVIDSPRTGTRRSRKYKDDDDATVYRRLQELSDVQGGPEWTIDVDWADDTRRSIAKILRVRKRIGKTATKPHAVFETTANSVFDSRGASEARYSYTEDYSSDRGANWIVATSSGEGDARPESPPAVDVRPGWPRYEHRFTPSTSIKDERVLDEHARSELALMRDGANTWDITARWDRYPALNLDWALGDDVAWHLTGHRHPGGALGQGRAIGWELDTQSGTVVPILLEPQEGIT